MVNFVYMHWHVYTIGPTVRLQVHHKKTLCPGLVALEQMPARVRLHSTKAGHLLDQELSCELCTPLCAPVRYLSPEVCAAFDSASTAPPSKGKQEDNGSCGYRGPADARHSPALKTHARTLQPRHLPATGRRRPPTGGAAGKGRGKGVVPSLPFPSLSLPPPNPAPSPSSRLTPPSRSRPRFGIFARSAAAQPAVKAARVRRGRSRRWWDVGGAAVTARLCVGTLHGGLCCAGFPLLCAD